MIGIAILGGFAASFGTFSIVLGSGILPVPFSGLLRSSIPAGLLVGIVVGAGSPIRWRWFSVIVTTLVAVGVAAALFNTVADRALLVAEAYAQQIAVLVERHAAVTGHWPKALSEVPGIDRVQTPGQPWLAYPDSEYPKIAGFFINYGSTASPRIWVSRRRYGAEYNLITKTWRRL